MFSMMTDGEITTVLAVFGLVCFCAGAVVGWFGFLWALLTAPNYHCGEPGCIQTEIRSGWNEL